MQRRDVFLPFFSICGSSRREKLYTKLHSILSTCNHVAVLLITSSWCCWATVGCAIACCDLWPLHFTDDFIHLCVLATGGCPCDCTVGIMLITSSPSPFSCPSCLEYLRPCTLILLNTLALYMPLTYLLTFCEYRNSLSNSLRRQTLRQGSPAAVNQMHATNNCASTSATLDLQVLRRVNRGTWNSGLEPG